MRMQLALLGCFALAHGAAAQPDTPIDVELEAETVIVITPLSDDEGRADAQTLLGELTLKGQAETVLDNGVRVRARARLRVQQDHDQRPGGTGGFGVTPGAPVGAFSGLSAAGSTENSDLRARFETAYLQVDGGYGELRIGKDQGVAARFHEGHKSSLTHARLDSALLDPSGLATIRTRHYLTGPSVKISYASPRLIGLRAGISFTPQADADGLDRRPAGGTGLSAPDTRNAVEIAVNGSRKFRDNGLRLDAALAWSSADVQDRGGLAPYARVETVSAGTRIEKDDWTFGASYLTSDNGLPDADYSAWSAGIARSAYDIDWSLSYGEAEDDGARLASRGWRFGGARVFGEDTRIAVAYINDRVQTPFETSQSQAVVVEITLSEEILKLKGN